MIAASHPKTALSFRCKRRDRAFFVSAVLSVAFHAVFGALVLFPARPVEYVFILVAPDTMTPAIALDSVAIPPSVSGDSAIEDAEPRYSEFTPAVPAMEKAFHAPEENAVRFESADPAVLERLAAAAEHPFERPTIGSQE